MSCCLLPLLRTGERWGEVNLDSVKILEHNPDTVKIEFGKPAMPKKKAYHHGDLKNALIEAGADILSKDGVSGLSLRKVALKAGVSHTAPYAHFADKQALIAAISTDGYRRLYEALSLNVQQHIASSA